MFTFLITLMVIAALLLILVVLAQNSKGGGLSSQFGGGGTAQVMGVKRTGDLLERTTWGLAIAILFLALMSHIYLPKPNEQAGFKSSTLERAEEQAVVPPPTTDIPLQGVDTSATDPALEGLKDEGEN